MLPCDWLSGCQTDDWNCWNEAQQSDASFFLFVLLLFFFTFFFFFLFSFHFLLSSEISSPRLPGPTE